MDTDKFIAAVNRFGGASAREAETIASAANAELETRIAALLWCVAASTLPVSTAACEVIFGLTFPEAQGDITDPLATSLGAMIAEAARNPDAQPPRRSATGRETVAAHLIQVADDPAGIPDESISFGLKMATGKDVWWWTDWIRAERERRGR